MRKNASIFNLLLTATSILLLFGCKKGLTEKQADPLSSTDKRGSTLRTLTVPDVYIAGSEGGQAKYWKNDQGVTLPGGGQATGIVVVGTDVYVCGYNYTSSLVAQYWKNGVLTTLSDGTNHAIATGIAVSGTDVYVSGKIGFLANTGVYWKNGVEIPLGAGDPNGVFAAANGDIYIPNSELGNPSYWKNGTLVTLAGSPSAYVRAIAVNGSDVFVVGQISGPTENALFWKNGVLQTIMTQFNTRAMAVAVNANGQAVFSGTTGQDQNNQQIAYWDGIQDLHILSSEKFVSTSTGIAVDQTTDDIYVCGSEYISPSIPIPIGKYWKISNTGSRTLVTLGNGTTASTALAITLGW